MMNEYVSEMVAREDKSTAEHSGCRKNQSGYQDSAKAVETDG